MSIVVFKRIVLEQRYLEMIVPKVYTMGLSIIPKKAPKINDYFPKNRSNFVLYHKCAMGCE